MENDDILTFVEKGMLKVVLNRPQKKNAITISMYEKLMKILHDSIEDNRIRMVVLTATGSCFSSGNDFHSVLTETDNFDLNYTMNIFKKFVDTLILYPKLLIAVINGLAIGIAVTILPLFDMVYTSDKAYFQTPFTSLGLSAEGCSTYTFPNILGHSKAGDMLYLGYKMSAFEAKQYRLVSEVYKHECLDEVWAYLKNLSQLSLQSIFAIKRLVRRWNEKILLEVNIEESNELVKCIQSSDFAKRITNMTLQKNKL